MNNPIKPIPCEILDIKKESLLEYTFRVKTLENPNHGQFMRLSIPKVGEAPIPISAYGDGWPFDQQFKGKHLVIITGGTGLAPVRSMLNACYHEDVVKSVTLISGFKNEEGIIFRDELEKWKDKFTTYYRIKLMDGMLVL